MRINKLLRPADLAEKCGVSERVILEWKKLGMPVVKLGKAIFILEDSFIRWLKTRESSG